MIFFFYVVTDLKRCVEKESFFYLVIAVCHANAIIKLIDKSTGMISLTISVFILTTRKNPLPTATIDPRESDQQFLITRHHPIIIKYTVYIQYMYSIYIKMKSYLPVAPFRLSTQPGKGSCRAAVTIDGLTITSGIFPRNFSNNCSAKVFVYVYVFGHFPNNLQ